MANVICPQIHIILQHRHLKGVGGVRFVITTSTTAMKVLAMMIMMMVIIFQYIANVPEF